MLRTPCETAKACRAASTYKLCGLTLSGYRLLQDTPVTQPQQCLHVRTYVCVYVCIASSDSRVGNQAQDGGKEGQLQN